LAPMAVLSVTTLSAGWLSFTDLFLPMTHNPSTVLKGWLNAGVTLTMMACVLAIVVDSARRWRQAPGGGEVLVPVR
jgi:hypothetical protein